MKRKMTDFEITFFEGIVKERPDYIDALIPLAAAYTEKKRYQEGLSIDQRLSELCREDPVIHYNLACSYALVGDFAKSVDTLRRAIELGYRDLAHLLKDKDLKPLHGFPDFEDLILQFPA